MTGEQSNNSIVLEKLVRLLNVEENLELILN